MALVGPTRFLLAEIRSRALAFRRRTPSPTDAGVGDLPPSAQEAAGDLSTEVARALAAIAPDDPQRHRKAFRAYLQAVLAKECGIRQKDDPVFQSLVDQVQGSMELDPRIQGAIVKAGRLLMEEGPEPR